MKLLCSILAILILVLSCIPCCDAGVVAVEQVVVSTTAKSASQDADKSGQEQQDLCSPFCQCSCCAIAYALPASSFAPVTLNLVSADKIFASYLQQRPVQIALPVWQPPRQV